MNSTSKFDYQELFAEIGSYLNDAEFVRDLQASLKKQRDKLLEKQRKDAFIQRLRGSKMTPRVLAYRKALADLKKWGGMRLSAQSVVPENYVDLEEAGFVQVVNVEYDSFSGLYSRVVRLTSEGAAFVDEFCKDAISA